MLSRKEIIKTSVLGGFLVALVIGGEVVTAKQQNRVKDLLKIISDNVAPNAINELAKKKKDFKKLKLDVARWKTQLDVAEKFFPKAPNPPISNEQVAGLVSQTSATLVKCDNVSTSKLSWTPPKAAEGEGSGDSDDEASKANVVKYAEGVLQITLKGDYGSWLDFLVALEKLRKFYRFKELELKTNTSGKPDPQGPLTIDLKLASYHVIEYPSDRAAAEKKEE